ncbi:uncharacterized protein [Phyllobates terribilis]|uniref:uncharacterized protein n=1 Tax=Phyllobates terribilis TaxID=111132 RepID=UPI003CCB0994
MNLRETRSLRHVTPGFEDAQYPDHVFFLDNALYGLKQAPTAWYDCLFEYLLVEQKDEGIKIHQQKYLREILKKYDVDYCMSLQNHVYKSTMLDANFNGPLINETTYRGMVGSLMYLTSSRQDILFVVSLSACFKSDPRESHVANNKRIFRYLKGNDNICLWYSKHCDFTLLGYTNVDFAGYLVDRKSPSDMAQVLGPCLVSWGSKKQNSTAISTTEAEYIVVALCCTQLLCLKKHL